MNAIRPLRSRSAKCPRKTCPARLGNMLELAKTSNLRKKSSESAQGMLRYRTCKLHSGPIHFVQIQIPASPRDVYVFFPHGSFTLSIHFSMGRPGTARGVTSRPQAWIIIRRPCLKTPGRAPGSALKPDPLSLIAPETYYR